VTPLATSTFLQVLLASMIILPVLILWVAAAVDVFRQGGSGLKIAAMLVLILVVPVLGPVLYFVFRRPAPESAASVEAAYMAQEDLRREAARRPVGGTGMYR
jgi:hypothetical protein